MKQLLAFAGLLLSLAAVAPTARAALITYNNNSFVLVLSTGPSGNITSWNLVGSGNSTQTSSFASSTGTLVGGVFGEPVGVAGGFDYSITEPEACVNNAQCYNSVASTNQSGTEVGSWMVTVANNSYTYTYTGPNYSVFEAGYDGLTGTTILAPWATSDFISASFTFASPLGDNLQLAAVEPNVTSWTVSDGVYEYSGSQATSSPSPPSTAPEPSYKLPAGIGFLGLAVFARRRHLSKAKNPASGWI